MTKSAFVFPLLLVGLGSCNSNFETYSSNEPVTSKSESTSEIALMQQSTSMTKLYDTSCAKCHGANGEGGGAGTASLLTKAKYDQKNDKPYFDIIKNGTGDGGMDAYGQTLADKEIWGLVVHIRELQERGLRSELRPKATNGVFSSTGHPYKVETVVARDKGLDVPWGIDWLPDGTMLVTNRPGDLVTVKSGEVTQTIEGTPEAFANGQGGLMDVAVHPNYAKNGWIYLSFSDPGKANSNSGLTKIVRGKISGNQWVSQQTICEFDAIDYTGGGLHFGSRIVFDGKGNIFFALGDRGRGERAQDLTKPNGKIFRVKEDGSIPSDNPFAKGTNGALPQIWSYGHRNTQGLVIDLNGTLWDTEHGPRGGDEVNKIEKGANYGWPVISHSINYNDAPLTTPWPAPGQDMKTPVFRWLPSIGASGLDVVRGDKFPKWKGDLIAGGLAGANVDRIKIKDGVFIEQETLIKGMGRVRDVATGPDGFIYVALNQPDMIVRIVPAK